ncbi:hypothetical protein V8G61_04685 [Gaetbulibacter sp. M240]|uniref:hypothetical protein n=1 Tax=Gaetbulibacter sp. M240 TaxID=3126511 RepID=UPI00374FCAA7
MIPSHLYHYTECETLKLILESQTIRFTRLDSLNDPLEGIYDENSLVRNFVLSSSWTSEYRDELPMWRMYTDLKGVRFKMPIDLFSKSVMVLRKLSDTNFQLGSDLEKQYELSLNMIIPFASDSPVQNHFIDRVYGPTKVEYVPTENDLRKGVLTSEEGKEEALTVHLNIIGQRKIDFWAFEKEYRYRLFFNNGILIQAHRNVLNGLIDLNLSTKYIDIQFKKQSLEGIEILLGPKTDEKYKEQFNSLLNKIGVKSFSINRSKILIN